MTDPLPSPDRIATREPRTRSGRRHAIRNEKAKVGIEIHIPDDLEVMAEAAKPKLTV